jgi:sulfatase maturation enzyme AslB (radical SAM superfamily)
MNPHGVDILEYFHKQNKKLKMTVSTNGGARNSKFWQRLARTGALVDFCIDGLEDTHHLYRQNTVWTQVMKNAKIFIEAGGYAIWKMIKFTHNQHQIDDCQSMSKDLGFQKFILVDDGRNTAPVFNNRGECTHVLGNYKGETEFKVMFQKKKTDDILLEDIINDRIEKKIVACQTKILKSIYVAANGDVSPCCWTGFYPKTYGQGQYHQAANSQLIPMISKNNALEHPLHECIHWFAEVEKSWNIDYYQKGRLVICDDNCGS